MPLTENEFFELRGRAIDAYANLERSLWFIFAHAAGMAVDQLDVAGVIFYKITATDTRYGIIDRLIKKKYGSTYSEFWNATIGLIRQLTQARNHIVHWNVTAIIGDSNGQEYALTLPNFFETPQGQDPFTADQMHDFIARCTFFHRLCNMFYLFLSGLIHDEPSRQTWHDIFQQAPVYPPPVDHPLFHTSPKRGIPPQSSQELPREQPQSRPPKKRHVRPKKRANEFKPPDTESKK